MSTARNKPGAILERGRPMARPFAEILRQEGQGMRD
jgi:hypothetical protein